METMPQTDWKRPYRYLAALYYAFVAVAGLIVVLFQRSSWPQYIPSIELDCLLICAVLLYTVLDLVRIPLAGPTISLGFPVVLTALLVRTNPTGAILIAVAGSLISEWLYSYIGCRLRLKLALTRAVLYAGHHAVAGFAAAIGFLLFNPSLESPIEHLSSIGAYVLIYGAVSMLVLWPHDWWVSHLLALEEERLPRIEIISTLVVLTPIPVVLVYLYGLAKGPSRLVVYLLALLFLALLWLARSFVKTEVENSQTRIRDLARDQIGSPPNLAELMQNVFERANRWVKYQWGAVYSTEDSGESFRLRGERYADGSVKTYDWAHKTPISGVEPLPVCWPDVVNLESEGLGEVTQQRVPLVTFERIGLAREDLPRLPANTALMALPLCAREHAEEEEKVIGLLALARPRKLFTLAERDKIQALAEILGNTLYSVQRLESRLQDLYKEIDQFAQPELVQQALNDLIRLHVDVPRLLGAISERALRTNLRDVLREMVADRGQRERLALPPNELEKIYKEVQGETEITDMPAWSPEIRDNLQIMTSVLTLAFSFRYKWPEVARSLEYKGLYETLANALEVSAVPNIVAQGPDIKCAIGNLKDSSLAARDKICRQLERLQEVVLLLQESEKVPADAKIAYFGDVLQQLYVAEQSVRDELEDPERLTLVRIITTWQAVVTNALYAAREGGAQLTMALSSNWVLPLEEVTIQLRLENKGPGLASGVVASIQPSQDYQIGDNGRVEVGPLPAGYSRELDFKIKPHRGCETLRLVFQITYHDRERREKHEPFADRVCLREGLAPFTKIVNPYHAGRPLGKGSPLFFGREDVFTFIEQNITGSVRKKYILLLIGERRMGKTSIINQLPERLKDEPYIHVFFDCQGLADPGMVMFFYRLSDAIVKGLKNAGLPIEGPSPDDLKDQPQFVFEQKFLPKVWERIGDRFLLLAIDEFEALENLVQEGRLEPVVFPYLRSLMQSQDRMVFVFTGAHRVEELTTDYWSVLFNIAKSKHISFLDRESAVRLITEPVRPYGVIYDDLALDEVLRLTAGHPYFLQLICDCLVGHCNDQRRNYVTVQDVRDVRDEIMEQGHAQLIFVWQQSSREEQAVLAALASLLRSKQQVTAADIVEHLTERIGSLTDHVDFDLGVVTGALERLINRDIVRESSYEPPSYTFAADLCGEWIAKYRSLYKVVPELVKGTA